jgi:hypothetical protein
MNSVKFKFEVAANCLEDFFLQPCGGVIGEKMKVEG